MDTTNLGTGQPATLENVPPVLTTTLPTVIHGLETLTADPSAIGLSNQEVNDTTPNEQVQPEQQTLESAKPEQQTLTVTERIAQDPEMQKFLEAERARAVTGAQKRWDNEVLQKRLNADAAQREQALRELADKAEQGDQEALIELGKNTAAQITRKLTVAEFAQQWYEQNDQAVQAVFGDSPDMVAQHRISNYQTIPDWLTAVTNAKVELAKAEFNNSLNAQAEKLAEAKAVDILNSRRSLLPNPDTTPPVAGGGTPRKWNTLSEASSLLNTGEISMDEYRMADQWFRENRIKLGEIGVGVQ